MLRACPWSASQFGGVFSSITDARVTIYSRMNSMSSEMETSSATARPPVSRTSFHTIPKSLRLILVVALRPTFSRPRASFTTAEGSSTSSTTGLVVALMVRSPETLSLPGAAFCTRVVLNLMVGYFFTSKKSGPFIWVSRAATPLFSVLQSTVASTRASAGRFGSKRMLPLMPLNSPRTVEIIRWRTLKYAALWFGSIRQMASSAGRLAETIRRATRRENAERHSMSSSFYQARRGRNAHSMRRDGDRRRPPTGREDAEKERGEHSQVLL